MWVWSVVSVAYTLAESVMLPEGEICVQEMHALASSWQAFIHSCSIVELMAAVFWHSSHIFATFYLHYLSANTFDLCPMGPLMVAQAVVHPPAWGCVLDLFFLLLSAVQTGPTVGTVFCCVP